MTTTPHELQTTTTVATLPPGPRSLPYVGNLLSLRQDPLGYLQHLQRLYGNMATIHLGKTTVVLLFKPEYVRYVLTDHPRNFSNQGMGPRDGAEGANEGLLTIDGEKHRQQRRAVQPAFYKKRVESYATVIEQYTQELLKTWHTGDQLDMSRAMQGLTLRIVSKCLFNIDLSNQLDALSDVFNDMIGSSTSTVEDLLNLRIDNPITGYGRRRSANRRLNMLIYTLMAQRQDDDRDHNDVLSMLMSARSDSDPQTKLTDKQIHDHILTFLAAGHETTANALVWTFYLLARHPHVRAKLLDELRTILNGRSPTLEDLPKLTYTDWVLNESMRLYPPAWMQARFVAQDIELDGVRLPAGTLVMLSQWVLHRLPEIWDDAEVFRPERWDPEHGQPIPPGAYFPFGGGPRICIGMPFAQMEAKMILAMILRLYTPQPPANYQPGLKPTITLRPKRNLHVTLLPTVDNTSTNNAWQQLVTVPDVTLADNSERKGCRNALLSLIGLG